MAKTVTYGLGGTFLINNIEVNKVFTPEDFTEDHRMIVSTTKEFIAREFNPCREDIENQNFDQIKTLLHKAGEKGLLAHSVPKKYGGLGLDKISKAIIGETIGQTGAYGVAQSNHTCIATLPVTYFGTPKQKEKYLPKLASGEYLGAYCLTEPSSGSDALSAKTTAYLNKEGTHYILNGTKLFITNAGFSDTFIVYAKVDGTKFTAFIVEKEFSGLSLGPEEKKMGIKGSSTRPVILEDCRVPVENVLGEIGKGHLIAFNVLNLGRFNLGSVSLGAAKYALQLAVSYTKERSQFGILISQFTTIKEKIAKMAVQIYAVEAIQYRTAGLLEDVLKELDDNSDFSQVTSSLAEYAQECAICKVFGTETLDQVVDEALQIHGGYGYIQDYRVEQLYRDSRIYRIFEGTNEINRLLIANQFFKKGKKQTSWDEASKKALLSLKSPRSLLKGSLSREKEAVCSIRNILLVLADLMKQSFEEHLEEEQEAMMKFADIAILLYAAESAVLRTYKAILKNGIEKEKSKMMVTVSLIDNVVLEVEFLARKLIAGISKCETSKGYMQLIQQELQNYISENTNQLNRQIADQIVRSK